jgi:uncharacterized protein with PIN domain
MTNPEKPRFIADVMVGRLARWLRILGFDVLYSNRYTDDEIVLIAQTDHRIILTRDARLVARVKRTDVVAIEDDDYEVQLRQVVEHFNLRDFHVFSRCLECNEPLTRVDKDDVFEKIPPYVYLTQDEFAMCAKCSRVFWKGTHAAAIATRLKAFNRTRASRRD